MTITDRLKRACEFDAFKAERIAKKYAEAWADFAGLDENEKEEVVEEYMTIATKETARLQPLLQVMIEGVEALDTAIAHMEFCDSMDVNKTNSPTLDIFCKPALANIQRALDEMEGKKWPTTTS